MEHYFTQSPHSAFRKEHFDVEILGKNISIDSGSGIFSLKSLDFGTGLLIENTKLTGESASLLDIGCGYGIVGIALKMAHPSLNVTMSDINERAIRLSKENCRSNNVECRVLKSDLFSNPELDKRVFDVILTNPPFSAGKKLCIELIERSYEHINSGGPFQLVAPHNKGGESLKKEMLRVFGNVGEVAKKRGYRVYISIKN